MRKIPLIVIVATLALLQGCGTEFINARMSPEELEAIAEKKMEDKQLELEKSLQLSKDLDLATLTFSDVSASSDKTLGAYMGENKLNTALLIFCKEDNAACRMVTRDLGKEPIAANAKNFGVIGVLVDAPKKAEELPDYVKFDDHLNSLLDKELMESPDSDIVPYFALVYFGKSKSGIVSRWALDKVTHSEIKTKVEEFLGKLGVQP